MPGYWMNLLGSIVLSSGGVLQQPSDDGLRLSLEPVKRESFLYEPVVVRIILENTSSRVVSVSSFWLDKPAMDVWDSGALQILFVAVPGDVSKNEVPPPDEAFQDIAMLSIPHYLGGRRSPLVPQGRRRHFHPLLWNYTRRSSTSKLPSGHYIMPVPGMFWIKARFRHHNPPLESAPVPIQFHPVPEKERGAAEVWKSPSFGCVLQYGWDQSEKDLSREEASRALQEFVRRFPDSVYTPYARAALDANLRPILWAQEYYEQVRPETSPIQVALRPSKRRYLYGEPFLVMAEVKNVSDKPVQIDPRLEHVHGWMKICTITDLELKRWRRLDGLEPGFPNHKSDEPVYPVPKDWQPVALAPGDSRRKVFFFPNLSQRPEPSWFIWGEYRGGPGGLIESEALRIETVGAGVWRLAKENDFARRAIEEGIPKHEVEPLQLWLSEPNVFFYLETGNERVIPDRRSGREVLEQLVKEQPTSLYAFYARAALEHPNDWAERLMNDSNTQWPQVSESLDLARFRLIALGGGIVLLLAITVVLIRHRRPSSTPAYMASGAQ